jgi:glutamate-5-semialdehyde dehydrogenase
MAVASELSPALISKLTASKAAAISLATLTTSQKDGALLAIADAIDASVPEILVANARDLEAGTANGTSQKLFVISSSSQTLWDRSFAA